MQLKQNQIFIASNKYSNVISKKVQVRLGLFFWDQTKNQIFLTKTLLRLSQLYLRLRASGNQSGST